ncbi:MAG: glycosyltransferase [Bryobacteraceae bacterium]
MTRGYGGPLRIVMVTPDWPDIEHPHIVPFLVQHVAFLRRLGVSVDVFHFKARRSLLNYISAWFRFKQYCKKGDYDVIHCQFGQSGLVVFPTCRPVVVTYHGSDLHGIVDSSGAYTWSGKVLRLLSGFVALCADETVIVSKHLQKYLPPGVRSHVAPLGVNLALFTPMERSFCRQKLELPQKRILAMFSGRPNAPEKRRYLAQQAVDLLKDRCDIDLLYVEGKPHNSMPYYLNACNLLLLTSLHEGSPTIVKEALACNIPVVSAPVGDVPERLQGLAGCVLFREDTPAAIAAAILKSLATASFSGSRATTFQCAEPAATHSLLEVYSQACGYDVTARLGNTDVYDKPNEVV